MSEVPVSFGVESIFYDGKEATIPSFCATELSSNILFVDINFFLHISQSRAIDIVL